MATIALHNGNVVEAGLPQTPVHAVLTVTAATGDALSAELVKASTCVMIVNDSDTKMYVKCDGENAVSGQGIPLQPNGYITFAIAAGNMGPDKITIIHSGAPGNKTALLTYWKGV